MKSTTYAILISLFLLCTTYYSSNACHQGGFDLRYTHLNGPNYRVQCTFYKDCFGINLSSLTLSLSSVSCGISQTYTMLPVPNSGQVVTPTCPGDPTICNGGTEYGIEKLDFEVDIVLYQCQDWIMSVSDCCRNSAITTFQNPGDLVIEARLDNSTQDNSSPVFSSHPFFTGGINQDFHFNNGAIDPDGDSLVYNLITPRASLNTPYIYNPGFSSQQPFQSTPGVTLDHFTGDYFIHPTTDQVGVTVFEIQEFRNGQFIGSTTRDVITLFLSQFTNKFPHLTGVNGGSLHTAAVFPGQELCFDILSSDDDAADQLIMDWNHGISTASFSVNSALHPTGTFCWTPSWGDLRSQPYLFTVTVQDDGCPHNLSSVYSFAVSVSSDSSLISSATDLKGSSGNFFLSPNPTTGLVSVLTDEEFSEVSVFSPFGKCILEKNIKQSFDMSDYPAGIYFVQAVSKSGNIYHQKILKE